MTILKNIDWIEDLERENAIFYVTIYYEAYGSLLLKTAGFRYKHLLSWHTGKFATFFKSKKEMQKSVEFFLRLIKEKSLKLQIWHKRGLEYMKREQQLINTFSKEVCQEEIVKNYDVVMDECEHIFMYLTVIPFLVLGAIESCSREEQKKYEQTKKDFQYFRKTSRVGLHELVFEKIWGVAAQISGWQDKMDFSYFTIQEMRNLLRKEKYPNKEEIEQRKKGCALYHSIESKEKFYYDPLFLEKIGIKKTKIENYNQIQGEGACKGYVQGRVCIINRVSDMKKFQIGDIIVSINTNPSLLPVLTKCKAIVTNDGGLLCHAAIISREMNIPCIIGTKIATKAFKDGDIVEVDAEKGIVKKLK